jgi:hypothetical protein
MHGWCQVPGPRQRQVSYCKATVCMPLQFVVIRLDDAKGTQRHRNFIRWGLESRPCVPKSRLREGPPLIAERVILKHVVTHMATVRVNRNETARALRLLSEALASTLSPQFNFNRSRHKTAGAAEISPGAGPGETRLRATPRGRLKPETRQEILLENAWPANVAVCLLSPATARPSHSSKI